MKSSVLKTLAAATSALLLSVEAGRPDGTGDFKTTSCSQDHGGECIRCDEMYRCHEVADGWISAWGVAIGNGVAYQAGGCLPGTFFDTALAQTNDPAACVPCCETMAQEPKWQYQVSSGCAICTTTASGPTCAANCDSCSTEGSCNEGGCASGYSYHSDSSGNFVGCFKCAEHCNSCGQQGASEDGTCDPPTLEKLQGGCTGSYQYAWVGTDADDVTPTVDKFVRCMKPCNVPACAECAADNPNVCNKCERGYSVTCQVGPTGEYQTFCGKDRLADCPEGCVDNNHCVYASHGSDGAYFDLGIGQSPFVSVTCDTQRTR